MNTDLSDKETVILADGAFPRHSEPLMALKGAGFIVCCDGAAASLVASGLEPGVIVGDLDSLGEELSARFSDRLEPDTGQDTNDLTKAVRWCISHGARAVTILGATGLREDHTLGNISLLADYGKLIPVKMLTDTGLMFPEYGSCTISSYPGQRVSVISLDTGTEVTSEGLRYQLNGLKLDSWWTATLNEATGNLVTLSLSPARLIIYQGY